jgi:hypothetical protein
VNCALILLKKNPDAKRTVKKFFISFYFRVLMTKFK